MIRFKRARPADAPALAELQTRTFDDDSRRHGQGDRGGPPGYDSQAWQREVMRKAAYYKVLDDERIIGGVIVFNMGGGHYELARVYIDPDYQGRGIGGQVIDFIERAFPARRWTLDTPAWALRNQHFYEKHGYVKIGEEPRYGTPFPLVLYEKQIDG